MQKTWSDLVHPDDGFGLVKTWIAEASVKVVVLERDIAAGRRALEALQISTRSPLGSVAFHTGGLLVDHGWLRVLGAGCDALPRALDTWNGLGGTHRCDEGLLVADDAVGGFFAWFREPRTVHYLAPDTLRWEDLRLGYADWLATFLSPVLTRFYQELRWDGWRDEVTPLRADCALSIAPPLVLRGPCIGDRSRKAVPVEELWAFSVDVGRQLAGVPDGTSVVLRIT